VAPRSAAPLLAGFLDHRAEHAGELVQQHRVDLDLVVEGQAGEQAGEAAPAGLFEPLKRLGIGAGEVEGAGRRSL
jgi:hypothetical protein